MGIVLGFGYSAVSKIKVSIGIDIYILICIKWKTNKNLLYKKINKILKFKKSLYSLGVSNLERNPDNKLKY